MLEVGSRIVFLNPVPLRPQVKFMKSKPGAAMVEMGDCYAVDRAISHLNNNFLFGQKLNVWLVLLSNSAYTLTSKETD
jgi:hypothetical protein